VRRLVLLLPFLLLAGGGCRPTSHKPAAVRAATGRGPSSGVRFVNAAAEAGIRFRHMTGASGKRYLPETMGSGCAFLDFDGDGWLDILLLNGTALPLQKGGSPTLCALYRNQGDGTFKDMTLGSGLDVPMYAMGCAVGDYDNDGRDDLYVTCVLGPSRLFRNEGGGRFRNVTTGAGVDNHRKWGTSCAWVDIDNDGWLDLFITNYVQYSLEKDRPCVTEGQRFYCRPSVYTSETPTLYRNRGDGTFEDVSARSGIADHRGNGLGVAVWDFDADRKSDLVVANDLGANFLFHNLGDGNFKEVAMEWGVAFGEEGQARSGMGVDVADYRNDGRAAILISNFSAEPLSFFYQDAPALFSDITYGAGTGESHLPFLGFGLCFLDADNDRLQDAFVANGHIEPNIQRFGETTSYGQRNQLYRNSGDGTLQDLGPAAGPAFSAEHVSRGAAAGDYDNDGDVDVLVSNNGGPAELLRNDSPRRSWLQIRVAGSETARINRSGIGTRLRLSVGGAVQTQYVKSGSSYCSAGMLRLHFGLGSASQADWVEVRWTDGQTERHENVPADRLITFDAASAGSAPRPR
jgi:enediyne biosynthesis protein E4